MTTRRFGRPLVYLETTTSTNDVARVLGRRGSNEGTLVLAEEQTAGRGRLSRSWVSPAGSSILLSLLLRPSLAPRDHFALTMLSALATARAAESAAGLVCAIKWPNDVQIAGKKLAGILTELELVGERVSFAVVGIGINVNLDPDDHPEIALTATSLAQQLGHPVPRLPLLVLLLQELESLYSAWLEQGTGSLRRDYRARLATLGRWVSVEGHIGWAEGLDDDGALLLRQADGVLLRVTAGDVSSLG